MAQSATYFLSNGHEDLSSYSQKSPEWWLSPVTQHCGEKAGIVLAEQAESPRLSETLSHKAGCSCRMMQEDT